MAAQDEREPGVVGMCNVLGPMAQDIPVQDESLPQTNPKPEMAAVYDTPLPSSETLPRSLPKRLNQAHPT